jgi:outer membrane protein assembly factor BamB
VKACACIAEASSERTIGVLGTKVRISAEALAEDGTIMYTSIESSALFSWSSSAPNVATVEVTPGPFGGTLVLATGVSEGTAMITATSEGVTGEMTVTVRDRARLAWSVPLSGPYGDGDIAIGYDGTIYVSTFGDGGSTWHAVSPQGAVLWSLDLPRTNDTPAIRPDGTLYGALLDGGLVAVSSGGSIRWILSDIDGKSSPAIGSDGTVYLAGLDHVYAVSPQGELQWTFETTGRPFAFSSPAVASDGTIYVGGKEGRLYAINADGSLRWTFDAGEDNIIYSAPSISRDGTVYFGALEGVFGVAPDGSGGGRLLDRRVLRSPSIGPDGTVHVGALSNGVYAMDLGGVRWHYMPNSVSTTPILGADGTVYVTGRGPSGLPSISALDSQGRLLWDYQTAGPASASARQSPAIGIAVSRDPVVLYAIVETESANGGYAGAPWPQARGNRANTGRAGG